MSTRVERASSRIWSVGISLSAVIFVASAACADDKEHVLVVPATVPIKWTQVSDAGREKLLQLLATQTEGNFAIIRTWQGEYAVEVLQPLSAAFLSKNFPKQFNGNNVQDLTQKITSVMRFALDVDRGAIFRSLGKSQMTFLDADSKEVSVSSGLAPVEDSSLLTPEEYVHCSPGEVFPNTVFLPNHPTAKNKRHAIREAPEVARSKSSHFGDLMDPRFFFGLNTRRTMSQELRLYLNILKKEGEQHKDKGGGSRLTAFEGRGQDGQWYRISMPFTNPDESQIYVITTWSEAVGFNPVTSVTATDAAASNVLKSVEWQWKQSDGVYIPFVIDEAYRVHGSGNGIYKRRATNIKSQVNAPLPPGQLSYSALGLREGDLIIDKSQDVVYTLKKGAAERLAAFNEPYVPSRGLPTGFWNRWGLFLIVNGVMAALILSWWTRTRTRRRSAER